MLRTVKSRKIRDSTVTAKCIASMCSTVDRKLDAVLSSRGIQETVPFCSGTGVRLTEHALPPIRGNHSETLARPRGTNGVRLMVRSVSVDSPQCSDLPGNLHHGTFWNVVHAF